MPYYNEYLSYQNINSLTKPQIESMKPESYFLDMLVMNYKWTNEQGLDRFSFRISPSFVFWRDCLVDTFPVWKLGEFLFGMMDKAGLLSEPVLVLYNTYIPSKNDDSVPLAENWNSHYVEDDKRLFDAKYDFIGDSFRVQEAPLVLQKNPKAILRQFKFLEFVPKANP